MGVDWISVSQEAFAGLITLGVSFATLLLAGWLRKRRDKKKEGILFELAVLRGHGVELRNQGERREMIGSELSEWKRAVERLESAMIAKATEISKVETKRLEYLDRMQALSYPHIGDSNQVTALQNLSGLLLRADTLLAKYRF